MEEGPVYNHDQRLLYCREGSRAILLEAAVRSCFAIFATHILSSEVDTTLCLDGVSLASRVWWLLRYFNPVNISWRYYSMLAYRLLAKEWGETQLALINFDAYPYQPPLPFVVGESIPEIRVRRLEISGILSSQGILSIIAAYQGIKAIQFATSPVVAVYLATLFKPLAMLGLFRVMVSHWIANKVYVDPFPYPDGLSDTKYKSSKLLVCGWVVIVASVAFLSFYPYIGYPEFDTIKKHYLDFTIQIFYQYVTSSILLFHIMALSHGPQGLANRIVYFDHWSYKLQTMGFIFTFCGVLVVGLEDFIKHDFYSFCVDM